MNCVLATKPDKGLKYQIVASWYYGWK